jgi:hypothetical protein
MQKRKLAIEGSQHHALDVMTGTHRALGLTLQHLSALVYRIWQRTENRSTETEVEGAKKGGSKRHFTREWLQVLVRNSFPESTAGAGWPHLTAGLTMRVGML